MYRVRYLEQNDKMSGQVRLSMFEQVYERALLKQCAQQSVSSAQKARRVRHFTACWRWCCGAAWRKDGSGIS